jgi:hypothetical protein
MTSCDHHPVDNKGTLCLQRNQANWQQKLPPVWEAWLASRCMSAWGGEWEGQLHIAPAGGDDQRAERMQVFTGGRGSS